MQHKQHESRFLKSGHYAGLQFDDEWWFVQIVGTEYEEVKPWILVNENGNRDVLAPNTAAVDNQNITDTNENLILEPDDQDRNIIHQILFGVAPSRMQVFRLFGRERNNAVQDYDEPGDPAAYVTGFDSPYDNPSPQTEIMYINSMAPLRLQAYNPTDTELEARVSFHINRLKYVTITDKALMKSMLQGQQPAHFSMMGLGVQDNDQVGVPTWLNEAFGEHLYTTQEILSHEGNSSGDGTDIADRSSLERAQ